MSETHINAYFADVEDAKLAVEQAKANLKAAEARLAEKKSAIGFEEPEEDKQVVTADVKQPAKEPEQKKTKK